MAKNNTDEGGCWQQQRVPPSVVHKERSGMRVEGEIFQSVDLMGAGL